MLANHVAPRAKPETNLAKAEAAWGLPLPERVKLLAVTCDKIGMRTVAARLDKSAGYVSRVVNQKYAGSYVEAEKLVRAAFGAERVLCPLFGSMALETCIRNRRRHLSYPPKNWLHLRYDDTCPDCPNNTDRPTDLDQEED